MPLSNEDKDEIKKIVYKIIGKRVPTVGALFPFSSI